MEHLLKTKNKKFKETRDSRYIYQNELDKACSQHEMTYGDFKDLPRRPASDKVLSDKAFNIAKNPKYIRCQHGLVSWFINFLIKTLLVPTLQVMLLPNQELAEELNKPLMRKVEKV